MLIFEIYCVISNLEMRALCMLPFPILWLVTLKFLNVGISFSVLKNFSKIHVIFENIYRIYIFNMIPQERRIYY